MRISIRKPDNRSILPMAASLALVIALLVTSASASSLGLQIADQRSTTDQAARNSSAYSSQACHQWIVTSSPNEGSNSSALNAVSAVSPTEVWAVGYSVVDRIHKALSIRWNGREWNVMPSPGFEDDMRFVDVAALSADNVWTIGLYGPSHDARYFLANWNGSQWTRAWIPNLSETGVELRSISARSADDIWAVGSIYDPYKRNYRGLIAHYNGTTWGVSSYFASTYGIYILYDVEAIAGNDVWAVGYNVEPGSTAPMVLHWDGRRWSESDLTRDNTHYRIFRAIHVRSAHDMWVVGSRRGVGDREDSLLVEHFDGTQWTRAEVPNPSVEGSTLFNIAASSPTDIWAVGYFLASGHRHALLMHYDGNNWSQSASSDAGAGSTLNDVMNVGGSELIAVGYSSSGVQRTLIERYVDKCVSPIAAPTNTPLAVGRTPTPSAPVPTVQVPGANTRSFPETGKSAGGIFLDYWEKNGGLAQQGYPISDKIGEISPLDRKPYTVQYFERAVFEYHPENEPPYNVLLSQLGTFRYRQKYPAGAPNQRANQANARFFPETGHWVGGKFWQYWQQHGGLAQQGYPISEEFTEVSDLNGKPYTVQYFERAVFELHPENQPPYDVLLVQLGTFQYRQKYGGR